MRTRIELISSGAGHIHPAESIEALRLALAKYPPSASSVKRPTSLAGYLQ
jgi:hypothetical protein